MSYLVINGGKKLSGTITTQPNKNSALSILCACLMVRGKVTLTKIPQIADVREMIALLRSIGVKADEPKAGALALDASGDLQMEKLDRAASKKIRSSLFFLGALASRVRRYKLYKSGGCSLGERTVRPHLYALAKLGIKIISKSGYYDVANPEKLTPANIVLYESGDTTTENTVMAAALAPGVTTIKMASANYMVQDLCYFLQSAGARIEGIGTTTLTITGVEALHAVDGYPIMPDPIVAMTLLAAAITTGSTLTVSNCPLEFLELELTKLEVMGQKYAINKERLSANGKFRVADITVKPSELAALPDKIYGRPFPGLNIDNLPLFIPILCRARGRTLVHDWVYEDRIIYSLDLKKFGAKITLIDTHRVWVEGPVKFSPNEIVCPPALRPAVNILIVMLAAKGKSVLRNSQVIDRGYEDLAKTLNKAGADIKMYE